ncbi:MAG: cytochrome c [Burkholderiaceae bacterium]|nr:cytochrome c [Burkholderiaceae bacterium]
MTRLQLAGLASLLALAGPACADELGRKVFTEAAQPPCALCHTLEAAGATGTIGPSLDELKPDKARVMEAVRTGIGVMPRFADQLSAQQIEAVADFVARAVSGR